VTEKGGREVFLANSRMQILLMLSHKEATAMAIALR
jgi:hypothetical protein